VTKPSQSALENGEFRRTRRKRERERERASVERGREGEWERACDRGQRESFFSLCNFPFS
jgi:hypothetical protein